MLTERRRLHNVNAEKTRNACEDIADVSLGITVAAAATYLAFVTVTGVAKPICKEISKGAKFIKSKFTKDKNPENERKYQEYYDDELFDDETGYENETLDENNEESDGENEETNDEENTDK